LDPARFEADLRKLEMTDPSFPVCDACGRRHSNDCRTVEYDDVEFNVCGYCIVPVEANPADFLAGKKGTEPLS
jgi:ribosome-binding protein aMBF1 (putative translation factor)